MYTFYGVFVALPVSQTIFFLASNSPCYDQSCRNPSFGLATKAKGVARLRAKRKEARESRQKHCKHAGQKEARELRQKEARESHHILSGVLESVRE
jgi:hypothetical protein